MMYTGNSLNPYSGYIVMLVTNLKKKDFKRSRSLKDLFSKYIPT